MEIMSLNKGDMWYIQESKGTCTEGPKAKTDFVETGVTVQKVFGLLRHSVVC
jgi:hypothetical protein